MKSALVLPSSDGPEAKLTVGEAAIRSSAPWVRALRDGGFDGLVLRWGDEIIIPGADLSPLPDQYSQADAVRFGYRVEPTELLASQKEWLVTDDHQTVRAELPRQPLARLTDRIADLIGGGSVHVNLGSFAASHNLLKALLEAFGDLLDQDQLGANWDPYVWMALHSDDENTWEAACHAEPDVKPTELTSLLNVIPDLWARAQRAKEHLAKVTGRELTVKLLDFGEPYWFDAGNHASLRAGLNHIFQAGRDGETIRAFLGLPEGLAQGESYVDHSAIAPGISLSNSVVIGSEINGAGSVVNKAIIVNSRVSTLQVGAGGIVLECECSDLTVDSPSGFAFRLSGAAHVSGDEVAAEIGPLPDNMRLSYFGAAKVLDDDAYSAKLGANRISFREAADVVAQLDPSKGLDSSGGLLSND